MESCVLVVAGSDSGAGAGIQADIKTCMALGVYATTAITAVTVQNTCGVRAVEVLPASLVAEQMRAVLEDFQVGIVKLGMLGSAATVAAVIDLLVQYPSVPVILDPVLVSTSGAPLLEDAGVELLRQKMLPRCMLVTPNLAEAALLSGRSEAEVVRDRESAAADILSCGVDAVLLKGGHFEGAAAEDWLFWGGGKLRLTSSWVETANTHGTGCTLASAVAAAVVRGQALPDAVKTAKAYLTAALEKGAGRRLGHGHGPMQHQVSVLLRKS